MMTAPHRSRCVRWLHRFLQVLRFQGLLILVLVLAFHQVSQPWTSQHQPQKHQLQLLKRQLQLLRTMPRHQLLRTMPRHQPQKMMRRHRLLRTMLQHLKMQHRLPSSS